MGSKRRNKNKNTMPTQKRVGIDSLEALSFDDLKVMAQTAPILLKNRIEKSLQSTSYEDVMKAQAFLAEQQKFGRKSVQPEIKSVLWNPSEIGFNGKGYRDPNNGVSFDTLNRMGDIFVIKAIINTRIEQVQNFLHYSDDEQKSGYKIRFKNIAKREELTKKELEEVYKKIEYIVNFLENGGENDKWNCEDNFQDFTRKVLRDSLCLDQLTFEVVRAKNMNLKRFRAVDAALIRQLDTNDPRYSSTFENLRYRGYLPRYAMVWDGQIIRHPATNESVLFYPWELGYGVRNKSSNVLKNGYGCSELENLIEIITWVLWGMQYNGNFFKQGSQPKGFINVKNGNIDQGTLNEFKQDWQQTMSTVYNAHKVPVIQGIDLEWIDLQHSNRDMEFTAWVKFLMVLVCAVYRIDPSELGFNFTDASQPFGQDGQQARLDHSRKKGLIPLLVFYQNIINKYIVSEIDEDLEFIFTGVEIEDEEAQVNLDKTKTEAGFVSLEDMFKKYSGRELDPEKDTILNNVYQQIQSAKMMGGSYMNDMADESGGYDDGGGEYDGDFNDIDLDEEIDMEKSAASNPILSEAFKFIDKQLAKK